MGRKVWTGIIIAINVIGIVCLIYFAGFYLVHDTSVSYPDAMLPMENWERGGMGLTIGLFPLIIANVLAFIFVGKGRIKKPLRVMFLIPSLICLGMVVHFWTPDIVSEITGKDTELSVPVSYVQVEMKENSEILYGLLYDDTGIEILDTPFEAVGVNVFIADNSNFSSRIEENKVVNHVIRTNVIDSQGHEIPADDMLQKILQAIAAGIDHDIIEAKIFKDGENYFIAVQLNVNWQSPCDFYRFDAGTERLEYLYTWEDADVQMVSAYKE